MLLTETCIVNAMLGHLYHQGNGLQYNWCWTKFR